MFRGQRMPAQRKPQQVGPACSASQLCYESERAGECWCSDSRPAFAAITGNADQSEGAASGAPSQVRPFLTCSALHVSSSGAYICTQWVTSVLARHADWAGGHAVCIRRDFAPGHFIGHFIAGSRYDRSQCNCSCFTFVSPGASSSAGGPGASGPAADGLAGMHINMRTQVGLLQLATNRV